VLDGATPPLTGMPGAGEELFVTELVGVHAARIISRRKIFRPIQFISEHS
jgi:hypothetical protein